MSWEKWEVAMCSKQISRDLNKNGKLHHMDGIKNVFFTHGICLLQRYNRNLKKNDPYREYMI